MSKATGINKNLSDDEAAMKTAAAAIEACAFELPVALFSVRLDSMEANPGDGAACDSFMADVRSQQFPLPEHSFSIKDEEYEAVLKALEK